MDNLLKIIQVLGTKSCISYMCYLEFYLYLIFHFYVAEGRRREEGWSGRLIWSRFTTSSLNSCSGVSLSESNAIPAPHTAVKCHSPNFTCIWNNDSKYNDTRGRDEREKRLQEKDNERKEGDIPLPQPIDWNLACAWTQVLVCHWTAFPQLPRIK